MRQGGRAEPFRAAMDALLGVVFVAQLPSQPPTVIYQHPRGRGTPCQAVPRCAATPRDATLRPGAAPGEDSPLAEYFGIPAMILAKLSLPDEMLCNRPFYLEMDAGQRETSHEHGPHSHLHFVSFPCNVSEFSRPDASQQAKVDPKIKVQRFNIVHVLDSLRTCRHDKQASTMWQVSAHVSRALVSEETREGYLSKELQRLAAKEPRPEGGRQRLCLEQLLQDMFEGVKQHGHKLLRVNGSILCQVSVFPKQEAPAPPSAGQALALSCHRDELMAELPVDFAEIVLRVVENVAPTVSLGELMVRLALPLGTLQRVAQHLVYWKKARVVDVFQPTTRLAVTPGITVAQYSAAARRFYHFQEGWQGAQKTKAHQLMFSEVIAACFRGLTLEEVRAELDEGVDFNRVLEWFIAEGLVVQLATYCHFLPMRADPDRSPAQQAVEVNTKIRREFCPEKLTEKELELLACRARNDQHHLFLCRFVVEFARAHCRIDGSMFAAFVESLGQGGAFGLDQAQELISSNSDVFARYVCICRGCSAP